jgi:uncharacterized membrane protein
LEALSAHVSAARWAAKGVLLRLPLNPDVPAVAQHNTSPLTSVIVTIVLLNVALTYAIARVTFRRTFFRFDFANPVLQTMPICRTIFQSVVFQTLADQIRRQLARDGQQARD